MTSIRKPATYKLPVQTIEKIKALGDKFGSQSKAITEAIERLEKSVRRQSVCKTS